MALPGKKYETLKDVQESLEMSDERLYYALENGLLKVSTWLPLRHVEKLTRKGLLEGLVSIRPRDARAIFDNGHIELKRFKSFEKEGLFFTISEEPLQQPYYVYINKLLVTEKDKEEFKRICKTDPTLLDFKISKNYHKMTIKGETFRLTGHVQRSIIKQLHEELLNSDDYDNSWVSGKILLHNAGANSKHIRDIFGDKSVREKLIESDGNGSYRLKLPL